MIIVRGYFWKGYGIGWGDFKSIDSKISMKAPNIVRNFLSLSMQQNYEDGPSKSQITNTNIKIYVLNPKGKNHREGEKDFTIIMVITMVIL